MKTCRTYNQTRTGSRPSPGGVLQRKCACGSRSTGGECEACGKKRGGMLQRKSGDSSEEHEVPPIVNEVLNSPGQPLDAGSRAFFEPRFGRDFSNVRIHNDAEAMESARAVHADAYTVGHHVVFGSGERSLEAPRGRHLLAHELTHVVQQRGYAESPGDHLEIGPANDAFELEAERTSQAMMFGQSGAHPASVMSGHPSARISRGFFSDLFTRPLKAIARLFGSENYSSEELQAYLKKLRETNQIEGEYDSDNKARAIVNRRSEFLVLSLEIRVLLIREMLKGATLGADEAAILSILRSADATERRQMVERVGRARLWEDFSGANRRELEAITLTAADFNDRSLVDRLRSLPTNELAEYRDRALDADVRANIVKILAMQKITTPLAIGMNFTPGGAATATISGFEVRVLPDENNAADIPVNKAFTTICVRGDGAGVPLDTSPAALCSMQMPVVRDVTSSLESGRPETERISSFTPPAPIAVIQTRYGRLEEAPGKPGGAKYGRGTTPEDIRAGNTSLQFHESQHGADLLKFLGDNPAPIFGGTSGMTLEQFRAAEDAYRQAVTDYSARANRFTAERTDCAGTPISSQDLAAGGFPVTLCSDLEKRR
jgi:uncharacterized protein DUF4157